MNLRVSNQAQWQDMLQRQATLNAERWISLLEKGYPSFTVAVDDYDNILRALEYTLRKEALFNLSIQLINLSFQATYDYADWDRWNIYLDQALAQSKARGDRLAEASLAEKKGDLLSVWNENKQAESYYSHSLEIYKLMGASAQYANVLNKFGQLHRSSGNPEIGLELCLQALEIVESLGDKEKIANTELGLSSIYIIKKDWESVLQSASRSYQLFKEIQKPDQAARALINTFIAWFRLGMWEELGTQPEELINELTEIGNVYILGKLKLNLGVFTAARGDFKGAEAYYLDALHLASQNQVPDDIALVSNNLGIAYTKMEDWESAEEMLLQSVRLYNELEDINSWINSMDNLALLYEAQGNTAVAAKTLHEALAKSTAKDIQPHTQKLLQEMQARYNALNSADGP